MVAVLQGWSKSTPSGHLISIVFVLAMGTLALWGVKTLIGAHR
jgi:hypothetical protein